jgi:hypothetical protein
MVDYDLRDRQAAADAARRAAEEQARQQTLARNQTKTTQPQEIKTSPQKNGSHQLNSSSYAVAFRNSEFDVIVDEKTHERPYFITHTIYRKLEREIVDDREYLVAYKQKTYQIDCSDGQIQTLETIRNDKYGKRIYFRREYSYSWRTPYAGDGEPAVVSYVCGRSKAVAHVMSIPEFSASNPSKGLPQLNGPLYLVGKSPRAAFWIKEVQTSNSYEANYAYIYAVIPKSKSDNKSKRIDADEYGIQSYCRENKQDIGGTAEIDNDGLRYNIDTFKTNSIRARDIAPGTIMEKITDIACRRIPFKGLRRAESIIEAQSITNGLMP